MNLNDLYCQSNQDEMEITLQGFRSHDTLRTYTLPSQGLILLTGESGSGKSSLLDSINFALYGTGKKTITKNIIRNVLTYGFTEGYVKLVHDGLEIIRKKEKRSSWSLVVKDIDTNKEYIGDAAQEIINEKFGKFFTITSYITQKGKDSFFKLGPADKMDFLERIALEDVPVAEYRKKVKDIIKQRKELLDNKCGEVESVNKTFSKLTKPEEIPFPLQGKYSETKIANEEKKWKKNTLKLKKTKKELDTIKETDTKNKLLKQKHHDLQEQITNLEKTRDTNKKEIETIIISDTKEIENQINFLNKNKELTQTRTLLKSLQQQYDSSCVIELSHLQDELDLLEKIVPIEDKRVELAKNAQIQKRRSKLESKVQKLESEQEEYEDKESYLSEIENLRQTEQNLLQEQIIAKERKTIHTCPQCKTFLRLGKNKLEIVDGIQDKEIRSESDILSELNMVRNDKKKYETSVYDLDRIKTDIFSFQKELSTLEQIETLDYDSLLQKNQADILEQESRTKRIQYLKGKIKNKEFSATIQALQRKIESKADTIKHLEYEIKQLGLTDTNRELSELTESLTQLRLNKQKHDLLSKQQAQTEEKIKALKIQISSITIDETDFESQISKLKHELSSLETEEKLFKERSKKISEYLEYKRTNDTYLEWQKKSSEVKEEEENAMKSLSIAKLFLSKIDEVKSTAIMTLIENINYHLKYYLDKFFTDPINVEISPYTENSSGDIKPVINIKVDYKGAESDLDDLSGGERARVELAICLAINDLMGSKLLILDEVLKSLNETKVEEICDCLRTEALDHGKLVIVVLHNANESLFDGVVDIESFV